MVVKTLRDKKSGQFLGSVGLGKVNVPAPTGVSILPRSRYASEDELDEHYQKFMTEHPVYSVRSELGHLAANMEYHVNTGRIPPYAHGLRGRFLLWKDAQEYKLARDGNTKTVDWLVCHVNPDKESEATPWGLLLNKNLSEDHLLMLASRFTSWQWMYPFIHHPAAKARLLWPIVSVNPRKVFNSDQQTFVARLPNLPESIQHKLAKSTDPDVRAAFLANPTIDNNLRVSVALSEQADLGRSFSTLEPHPYKFPIPERFKKFTPSVGKSHTLG